MKDTRIEPRRSRGTNPGSLHFNHRKAGCEKLAILIQNRTLSQVPNQKVAEFKKSQ